MTWKAEISYSNERMTPPYKQEMTLHDQDEKS